MNPQQLTTYAVKLFYGQSQHNLFMQFEDLGKRNNVITDQQTYSFNFKGHHHVSKKLHKTFLPPLVKELHNEGDQLLDELDNLNKSINKLKRVIAFILANEYSMHLATLLPNPLTELLSKHHGNKVYKEAPKELVDKFNSFYLETIEDLFHILLSNTLES